MDQNCGGNNQCKYKQQNGSLQHVLLVKRTPMSKQPVSKSIQLFRTFISEAGGKSTNVTQVPVHETSSHIFPNQKRHRRRQETSTNNV